jgi:CDP-paratose 2-epimerase
MKILVTGGSGYLGIHVRRFFSADDFSRRSNLNLLDDADLAVVENYDVVIHLAAHLDKAPEAAPLCFRTNSEATANLVRRMRPGGVLIYASTKDVYGPHADSYEEVPEECSTDFVRHSALEWSKLVGEKYIDFYARQRDIRACIFRMSTVYARPSEGNEYGFVTHYVESVKRGWPLQLPLGGNPVRDILHVEDFSRAIKAFIDSGRPFGLYNLGGGKANSASLRDIVETVGKEIQIEPVYQDDDSKQHPIPVNYVSDLRKIKQELGWEPGIGIAEGLRSLL